MPYRQTDRVWRKLAERRAAILTAAEALAAEGGLQAVQIVPVAQRAGIAAGTVYRYFPAKTDLVTALIKGCAEADLAMIREAARAAPGPLSALSASIVSFAARALQQPRLSWAVLAEPIDPDLGPARSEFRERLAGQIEECLRAAIERGSLPAQDTAVTAAAIVGALLEGLLGPLAPHHAAETGKRRDAVQTLTLFALRGAGVIDARARGLVVQTAFVEERER
jgi:AcrR family transcriptional regulator